LKYLLDTNVISQSSKPNPDADVARWIGTIAKAESAISAITIQEIRAGLELMPAGKRRQGFELWLENNVLPSFSGRILSVDAEVADVCGRLVADVRKQGHEPDLSDALIAATAKVHGLRIATLNRKHFKWFNVLLVNF
jgi:predicted nucleic acid-binding protein